MTSTTRLRHSGNGYYLISKVISYRRQDEYGRLDTAMTRAWGFPRIRTTYGTLTSSRPYRRCANVFFFVKDRWEIICVHRKKHAHERCCTVLYAARSWAVHLRHVAGSRNVSFRSDATRPFFFRSKKTFFPRETGGFCFVCIPSTRSDTTGTIGRTPRCSSKNREKDSARNDVFFGNLQRPDRNKRLFGTETFGWRSRRVIQATRPKNTSGYRDRNF